MKRWIALISFVCAFTSFTALAKQTCRSGQHYVGTVFTDSEQDKFCAGVNTIYSVKLIGQPEFASADAYICMDQKSAEKWQKHFDAIMDQPVQRCRPKGTDATESCRNEDPYSHFCGEIKEDRNSPTGKVFSISEFLK